MSFSTEFNAKTTESAKARIAKDYLPPTVRALVLTALENLEAQSYGGAVYVKAVGHLTSAQGDYNRSTADIVVGPLELI